MDRRVDALGDQSLVPAGVDEPALEGSDPRRVIERRVLARLGLDADHQHPTGTVGERGHILGQLELLRLLVESIRLALELKFETLAFANEWLEVARREDRQRRRPAIVDSVAAAVIA